MYTPGLTTMRNVFSVAQQDTMQRLTLLLTLEFCLQLASYHTESHMSSLMEFLAY